MNDIIAVGLGGCLGAIARYGLTRFSDNYVTQFPLGTLGVNVIGSLLLGFIGYSIICGKSICPEIRGFISIGFIGAFTTMSTFAYETIRFFDLGYYVYASLNVIANLALCLLAIIMGKAIAMLIFR